MSYLNSLTVISNKVIDLGPIEGFGTSKEKDSNVFQALISILVSTRIYAVHSTVISPKITRYHWKTLSKGNLSSHASFEQRKPESMKCLLSCTLGRAEFTALLLEARWFIRIVPTIQTAVYLAENSPGNSETCSSLGNKRWKGRWGFPHWSALICRLTPTSSV